MPLSQLKPKLEKNAFVLSASQLSTADLCTRKWWFEKVKKLPKLEKDYFTFGTVLHECIERFLTATIVGAVPLPSGDNSCHTEGLFKGQTVGEAVELFPKNWDKELTPKESGLIRKLVNKAIEEGIIVRNLEQQVELEFWTELFTDVWLTGFIDYTIPGEVHDHKSTKNFRYALSSKGLASNIQMLLYANIIGSDSDSDILLRHNYFLKDPDNPSIRKVEIFVTQDDLLHFWENMLETAHDLKYTRDNITEWAEIEDPTTPGACSKYGGCAFQDICCGITTVETYTKNIRAINKTTKKGPFKAWGFDSLPRDKDMGLLENKLKEQQAAAEVAPEEPTLSAPPWASEKCTACEGVGWNKKGNPCGICTQLSNIDMSNYEVLHQSDGTTFWEDAEGNSGKCRGPLVETKEVKTEVKQLASKISAPLTDTSAVTTLKAKLDSIAKKSMEPAEDPAPPLEETILEKGADPIERMETVQADDVAPKKRGRPKKAFTLAINCCPVRGTAKIRHLDILFKDLAQQVAEAKGKDSYYELPAFDRRDILAIKAEEIAEHLGTDICLARPDSPDMRAFVDMLRPYASTVWEPMAGTTTVVEG